MRFRPRALCLIIASAGMVFSAGCPGCWIRQSAVNAIAAEVQPPNPALVDKLETSGNPAGQGVIVFVRSQSDCAPQYSWIWVFEKTGSYALDHASQALTPRLRMLSEASPEALKRVGSGAETLGGLIRNMLCEKADRPPNVY